MLVRDKLLSNNKNLSSKCAPSSISILKGLTIQWGKRSDKKDVTIKILFCREVAQRGASGLS
jgi:hypothetical protein